MFLKPNAIVYVRRSGLIVAGKHVAPARLNFSPEIVDNLEILHPQKFITGCQDFFSAHDLHGKRVLLVLDNSVVFSKIIELDKTGKPAALAAAFVDAMPFDVGKRACVIVHSNQSLELYATNAELYESLSEALHLCGIAKLLAITPADAYHLGEDNQKLASAIEQFVADTKIRQQADFTDITLS